MYLKRLEISGFKSFSDNIRLDLEPGITGIVGPNGCGKSNIIDATRWCLGEMSAKSLRSSAMMDVVFNGSGSRPPQNLAEVTLTFDNTDRRLPIDYTEVSITRRLFRSGESEYFINKTQCRLRDIKELFLDTGMGEDGYYSMEQGKVEWILQAKPEERRELFEEAAGVSKYRARREEALRKLEKVEIDLSRLHDIISVTSDQIKKLENAVNKAKTYERVREDLKQMEIGDWLMQLSTSDQELTDIAARLQTAQQSAEEFNTQVHQLNVILAEHRLGLTQTEEELLQANSALNAIEADIKIGEERLTNSKVREDDLSRQLQNIAESVKREQARAHELAEQIKSQTHALEQVKTEGARIESDFTEAQKSFDFALQQLETKKKDVKDARDIILDRAQERARLQQQTGHLTSDVARFISQLENATKEKDRSNFQLTETIKALESAERLQQELTQQVAERAAVLESATQQMTAISNREDDLRKRLLTSSEDIAKLKGQIHSIQDQQTQDPYLAGTQAVLSGGFSGVAGPIGRLFQCSSNERDIVAAALGEHLGDLVADSTEDAARAIDYLKNSEKGRVRIWILDKLPFSSSTEGLSQLPGGVRLSSRLQCDEKYKPLLNHLCSSYWVQGTSLYGTALVNGGIEPSKWQSHITHRLPELEKNLEEQEIDKVALEGEIASLEEEMTHLASKRDNAIKEREEVRIRLELQIQEIQKILKKKEVILEEQQVIEIEVAQFQEEKLKAEYQLGQATGNFQTLQSREKDDHDQLDLLQQELTELQHVHAKANAELSAKTERHKDYLEKLHWQESVLQHSEREVASVKASELRHQQTSDLIGVEIETARAAQIEAKNQIESSVGKRQNAAEACAAIQGKRLELAQKIQTSEIELNTVRNNLAAAQETAQTELLRETTLRSKNESLVQKLKDQYELTIEDAKAKFIPQPADPETLERLKKRVTNMGPINLAAPQEHAELSEKNNFLTTQQNDLLKAKDDLKQVIAKINATTRDHFKDTFETIRGHFRTLYSKLFQGGEADLRFTDENDILNTGIDIFCQPPGKKLLHISLLSGGEKALTAIALLFAFFQVRPSPITLLDEVDAPLDEANVLRYVEALKMFSEKSQFLLITHNKRTMEAANTLYGVTMEELGVSKVLSARLKSKEAAAIVEGEKAAAPA